MLQYLPQDILIEIITSHLDIVESLAFTQTCRRIHQIAKYPLFWIHIIRCVEQKRPVPLPPNWIGLSVERLKQIAFQTLRLRDLFLRDLIYTPKRQWEIGPAGDCSEELLWVCLFRDGEHLMTMSKSHMLRVWTLESQEVVVRLQVQGVPLCWDYDCDDHGITIILNRSIYDESESPGLFMAWRYDKISKTLEEVVQYMVLGDVRANYIKESFTGCVGLAEDSSAYIYLVDWRTKHEVFISTPISVPHPQNLSPFIASDALFLFIESGNQGSYASYKLDVLSQFMDTPMRLVSLLPDDTSQVFTFLPEELRSEFTIPLARYLWNGKIGVFSRSSISPQFLEGSSIITLTALNVDGSNPQERVRRNVVHNVGSDLADAPEGWDLCGLGQSGKSTAWIEIRPNRQFIAFFANFPSGEDIEPSPDTMKIDEEQPDYQMDTLSSQEPPTDPLLEDYWAPLSGEDVSMDNVLGSPIHLNQSLSSDDDIPWLSPSVFKPVAYGHVCKFPLPDIDDYGLLYSLDFDDARGRLAIATSSGKVLLFDLV